ncbi:SCO family protein [Brevibacillus thermoruber]|jgi:protein SCO1|uniref:SCO family protein n=1 Tax=Brevibacillus thermoruber TaxID=33942 RepID=UPI00054FB0EA|nr:SCO family protein [Brevibacillus thermoruber]
MSEGKASFWQRHWFSVAAAVLALLVVGVFGYQYWQKSQIPVVKQMNDFTLDNIDGSTFTLSETNGKVRLVEFIFTHCPDICPATTFNMAKMQEQLKAKGLFGDKVAFVTITFDPERDTPEVLKAYADKFGADQRGWYFLRGDQAAVEKVTKDFGIAVLKQPDGSFAHTARMFLVDKDGNMRRMYGMASDMDMDNMLKDIEQLAD